MSFTLNCRCCIASCIITFIFLTIASGTSSAASISGTVSYNGSQTGTILVAVFNSPITCTGPNTSDPFDAGELASPSNFNISDLPDGTFYLTSVMTLNGPDDEIQATDPWAIYSGCSNIIPVVISNGVSVVGRNLTMIDGTNEIPNPFFIEEKVYHLIITGEAEGSIDFVKTINELWYSGFGLTGNGIDRNTGVYAILPFATHSPPLAYLPPAVGQSWTDSGYSNEYLINSVTTVKSVSEVISTPAGTFTNCAYVEEILTYPNGYTPGQPSPPTKYERWFCPRVGPVKIVITDSSIHTGELISYQNIIADNGDYFPLGPHFTWTFSMDGLQTTWTVNPPVDPPVDFESTQPLSWINLLLLKDSNKANAQDVDKDGYTVAQGDCNDSVALIHPSATEVCGDGIDQDCSGSDLDCNALQLIDQINTPPSGGTWVNITPINEVGQSFVPLKSPLTSVKVDIVTGNAGRGETT